MTAPPGEDGNDPFDFSETGSQTTLCLGNEMEGKQIR